MDIPLPEDIPFPGDEESPTVTAPNEDVCNIQLPMKAEDELIETSCNLNNNETSNECHDVLADGSGGVEVSVVGETEPTLQYPNVEEVETKVSNDMSCLNVVPMDEVMPVKVSVDEPPAPVSLSNEQIHPNEGNNLPTEPAPLPSNQLPYSAAATAATAANYMQYDPSMMSHNYSYMTANNYATHDYVSFYNNQQRMTAGGSYATAYHPYQSYSPYPYTTTTLQQMYDGRNMSAYTNANYAQQMLPQNPPLPPGQPINTNTFNPPLPTDYQAPAFPTATVTVTTVPSVDSEESGAPEKNVTNDNAAHEDCGTAQDKEQEDDTKERTVQYAADTSNLAIESVEQALDNVDKKSITDCQTVAENTFSEDINRYSPSVPMEEDETNQPENVKISVQSRPAKVSSVLGKAQAKKRLMAFSISKQAVAAQLAAKKQAQIGAKERRENDDADAKANITEDGRSSSEIRESGSSAVGGVFDDKHSKRKHNKKATKMEKARETMKEIEELKRNELIVRDNSTLYRQALINDNSDIDSRRNDSDRRKDGSSRRKSRSRSRSRRRSRSRSREQDRKSKHCDSKKKRRISRTRSLSRTKSRSRSGSHQRGDKSKSKIRASELKSWGDFKEAGFQLDRYRRIKFKENEDYLVSEIEKRKKEKAKLRRRHRSRSKERRSASIEKEVAEEVRKRKMNMFDIPMNIKQPLLCYDDEDLSEKVTEYPSHIVQYTNTKPVVKYCENVKVAKLHFISRIQLLDSVPDDILTLMKYFWNSLRSKSVPPKFRALA